MIDLYLKKKKIYLNTDYELKEIQYNARQQYAEIFKLVVDNGNLKLSSNTKDWVWREYWWPQNGTDYSTAGLTYGGEYPTIDGYDVYSEHPLAYDLSEIMTVDSSENQFSNLSVNYLTQTIKDAFESGNTTLLTQIIDKFTYLKHTRFNEPYPRWLINSSVAIDGLFKDPGHTFGSTTPSHGFEYEIHEYTPFINRHSDTQANLYIYRVLKMTNTGESNWFEAFWPPYQSTHPAPNVKMFTAINLSTSLPVGFEYITY